MRHLAVIMDGNRRWATEHNLSTKDGHMKGKDAARAAVMFCIKNAIKYLSLYTFSLENFNRSGQERETIFELLFEGLTSELEEFIEKGVRIRFVGDRSLFPSQLLPAIENSEERSKHLTKLQVNVLFCYGGQQELVCAMRTIAKRVQEGKLCPDAINEATIEKELWTAGTPSPDLIIRTSGVSRLSNFLLYQAAYSELAFLDCKWPEITEEHLSKCVDSFRSTRRNYGY